MKPDNQPDEGRERKIWKKKGEREEEEEEEAVK